MSLVVAEEFADIIIGKVVAGAGNGEADAEDTVEVETNTISRDSKLAEAIWLLS